MTAIEVIALIFAIILFIRGVVCFFFPKWSEVVSLRVLKSSRKTFNCVGVILIIIAFVLFGFILFSVKLINLIIILFAALFFMSGYSLLVAQKETKQLWKTLLSFPKRWITLFGLLNILVALIIVLLVF